MTAGAASVLLDSYGIERRPVAQRNTTFCSELFYETVDVPGGADLAVPGPAGERARAMAKDSIEGIRPNNRMSGSLGLRIGFCYDGSPVVAEEAGLPPVDYRAAYRPTTRPGARAPHAWLADGKTTLDLYGDGFVLLRLGASAPECQGLEDAARRRGVPLRTVALADPKLAELYEKPLVLVRPDGHVAWRGTEAPADPLALIDLVRGA